METLFNIPVTPGARQFMPENEANDNYPANNTPAALQPHYNTTAILTVNNLNYRHDVNQGKGAAIHMDIGHSTGKYRLVQDADLEHDPGDSNKLLQPLVFGRQMWYTAPDL